MTISSSLNAGVAGLQAHASRLAGISDNIANSATAGYRRVETDFASLAVLDTPTAYVAGGVRTASTRLIDEAGPLTSSTNATDLAVSGRGMIPVSPEVPPEGGSATTELLLTTTGAFRPDADGVLRDSQGNVLLGWPADAQGQIPVNPRQTVAALEAVKIDPGFSPGAATTAIAVEANLPATANALGATPETYTMTTEIYDTLGGLQTLHMTFTSAPPATAGDPKNTWLFQLRENDAGGDLIGEYDVRFDDADTTGGTPLDIQPTATVLPGTGAASNAYDGTEGSTTVTANGIDLDLDLGVYGRPGGLTQLSDQFAPAASRLNGAPAGTVASVEVTPEGLVRTISNSGFERTIYQIPLVDVSNPNGLVSVTGSTFAISSDSGPFYLWDAGEGTTGSIEGFSRQESATDVAGELTDLIQTQRAYSSNAKIIQTVDEMLQETTNIKR